MSSGQRYEPLSLGAVEGDFSENALSSRFQLFTPTSDPFPHVSPLPTTNNQQLKTSTCRFHRLPFVTVIEGNFTLEKERF